MDEELLKKQQEDETGVPPQAEEPQAPVAEEPQVEAEGDTQAPDGEPQVGDAEPIETPTPEPEPVAEPEPEIQPEPEPEPQPQVRTFTQDEVNDLVGKIRKETRDKTRAETIREFTDRYGVEGEDDLDGLFGNGQRYDALNEEYGIQSQTVNDLRAENALLRSGIPPERFDDVKAILAYSGRDVSPEAIEEAALTHPEWRGGAAEVATDPAQPDEKPSVMRKLGGEPSEPHEPLEDESAKAMKLFGL